jgi:L-fucose isomerase-like protein
MIVPFVPLASPLHDSRVVGQILDDVESSLSAGAFPYLRFLPLTTSRLDLPSDTRLVVVFMITGGTENLGAQIQADEYLLLTHRSHNSLPSALELRTHLESEGKRSRIVNLEELKGQLPRRFRAWQIAQKFRRSHFARIGGSAEWLVGSRITPQQITERWGIAVEEIELDWVTAKFAEEQGIPDDGKWRDEANRIPSKDLTQATLFSSLLRSVLSERNLDGVALSCFDFLDRTGTSGCLAVASLNDASLTAACEGDLPALLTMHLLYLTSGKPTFMGNPAWIERDRMLLAHCTIAPQLVKRFTLTTHFESGKSVAVQGELPLGPYTIAKISPGLDRILIARGDAEPWMRREDLCRTQVLLHVNRAERIKNLALANHLAIAPGDFVEDLRETSELLQLRTLDLR